MKWIEVDEEIGVLIDSSVVNFILGWRQLLGEGELNVTVLLCSWWLSGWRSRSGRCSIGALLIIALIGSYERSETIVSDGETSCEKYMSWLKEFSQKMQTSYPVYLVMWGEDEALKVTH